MEQDIVVTIRGTNDTPEITAINNDGLSLIEDNNEVDSEAETSQSLTGDIEFTDVDISSLIAGTDAADTHTVTAEATTVTLEGDDFTAPSGLNLDNLISFDTDAANADDATGNASENTVPWSFEINDCLLYTSPSPRDRG